MPKKKESKVSAITHLEIQEDILKQVELFQREHGIKSLSKAMDQLIQLGLEELEREKSTPPK